MATLDHHLHPSTFTMCHQVRLRASMYPPVQPKASTYHPARRRAIAQVLRRASTCRSPIRMAAHLAYRTHSAHQHMLQYHTPRVSTAQTLPPVLQGHQSNTPQPTLPAPQTAFQSTTTSTAHTLPSHPALSTAPPSPQQNTAPRHPSHPRCLRLRLRPSASLRRLVKCPHRSCPTPSPRHRNTTP